MDQNQSLTCLHWDEGSAYDFFASLHVLHHPEKFGLRASWAAGVRSRLPAAERKVLEEAQEAILFPLQWLISLPGRKDAQAALWQLGQLPPFERLLALAQHSHVTPAVAGVYQAVAAHGAWGPDDLEALRVATARRDNPVKLKSLAQALDIWVHAAEFGEKYLAALQAYYAAFFAEEEQRIGLPLAQALAEAQGLAGEMPVAKLVEKLSQGVSFANLAELSDLTLVPSYWLTPLIVYDTVAPGKMVLLFGARPADLALVPGETVPDAMLRALKALADPTRLKILRYLSEEALTPAELARRLRLRPPTVIHHLSALRLAGLVQLTLQKEDERHYAIRKEMVVTTFDALKHFLTIEEKRGK